MEINVCIGSACYVKGSHEVIQQLQQLIASYYLEEKVVLKAAFCLGHCTEAVCVTIEDQVYSVPKDGVDLFFREEVYGRVIRCKS